MKSYKVAFYARKNCWLAFGLVSSYIVQASSKAKAKEQAYMLYSHEVGTPLSITYFRTEITEVK